MTVTTTWPDMRALSQYKTQRIDFVRPFPPGTTHEYVFKIGKQIITVNFYSRCGIVAQTKTQISLPTLGTISTY